MKKIPLEETLGGAYRFLFTNIVSIIGTAWLPFVVFFGLCAGLVYVSIPHEWLSGTFPHFKSPQEVIAALIPILCVYPAILFLMLLMAAMVLAGLMRHALGLKTTTTFVYFSLGAPVWRMLGAFVLYYLVVLLLLAALALLFFVVYLFAVPMIPHGAGIAVLIVLGVIVFLFYIYAAVRLFFFFPAVVVAENRIGLGRSWSLGGGNFWRIVIVILLTAIPVAFVAQIITQMTVVPIVMAQVVKLHAEAMNTPHEQLAQIGRFLHALLPALPIMLAIVLIERIALLGLTSGAIGKAYNAVTKPDAPAAQ
jgi:hypothetical protein